MKKNLKAFSGDANITFAKLDVLAQKNPTQFKHLTVIASNLTRQQPQIFSAQTSPDLPIWHAVRASISIPLIFEPVKINNDYFVDGGLAWNYPIDLYDRYEKDSHTHTNTRIPNPATLGFYLEPENLFNKGQAFKNSDYKIDSLKTFAFGLSSYLYNTANAAHIEPCDRQRTVFIDDLGISATDFSLSEKNIDALIESGRNATERFFQACKANEQSETIHTFSSDKGVA